MKKAYHHGSKRNKGPLQIDAVYVLTSALTSCISRGRACKKVKAISYKSGFVLFQPCDLEGNETGESAKQVLRSFEDKWELLTLDNKIMLSSVSNTKSKIQEELAELDAKMTQINIEFRRKNEKSEQ